MATRMWMSSALAILTALAAAPGAADSAKTAAKGWGPPSIAYSADMTFTYGPKLKVITSFYYSPSRQRMDYSFRGRRRVMIVYTDARLVFELLPDKKIFRKRRVDHLPAWSFGASRADSERERVGDEVISGVPTVKYKVRAKTPYGERFEGFVWLDRDRVVIKLDGKQIRGKVSRPVVVTISNLRKGALDEAVFQVPAGFKEAPHRK